MSKHYWDEYLRYFIDDKKLNQVLKFHQSNINLLESTGYFDEDINKEKWIDSKKDRVIFSDILLKKYELSSLTEELKKLFQMLEKSFASTDIITTLPILVIYNDRIGIDKGCYTFNFKDKYLIKYCDFENNELLQCMKQNNIKASISYFLSIEESICIYGGIGYLKGIFQIGQISKMLEIYLNYAETKNIFINNQSFTHDLGINLRKQILIHTSFIGD